MFYNKRVPLPLAFMLCLRQGEQLWLPSVLMRTADMMMVCKACMGFWPAALGRQQAGHPPAHLQGDCTREVHSGCFH